MKIRSVGILSPGDMGHAIGHLLVQQGLDVIASLNGRSVRTQNLARQAGIRDVGNLEQLALDADMILSILVPAHAELAAEEMASAIRNCQAKTHYVDCNAVSPESVLRIEQIICAAGGRFTDGSVIGSPPTNSSVPRLYVSGPQAADVQTLAGAAMTVKVIGPNVGQASGIKMCYAALTKGTFALQYALAIVAQRLDLLDELVDELEFSQSAAIRQMRQHLPRLPAKAWRWIGEMQQIAGTFEHQEVPRGFFDGAADMYRIISESSLGQETPESMDLNRSFEDTIAAIAGRHD